MIESRFKGIKEGKGCWKEVEDRHLIIDDLSFKYLVYRINGEVFTDRSAAFHEAIKKEKVWLKLKKKL